MPGAPLAVALWQPGGPLPETAGDLWLAAVGTPFDTRRDPARQAVRQLLREALGRRFGCPPDAVPLRSAPGRAPRVEGRPEIGLSISHEPGLSLAAIGWTGPVGVDLLALPAEPPWQDEIPALARDYLGPADAARLFALPAGERPRAFAAAWSAHEACLKCLGMALAEWSPARAEALATCATRTLALPAGYVGSLARPARNAFKAAGSRSA